VLSDVVKAAELEGALFGFENLRELRRSSRIKEQALEKLWDAF
jgi:hypothetical protein